jgi:hypothetical protein
MKFNLRKPVINRTRVESKLRLWRHEYLLALAATIVGVVALLFVILSPPNVQRLSEEPAAEQIISHPPEPLFSDDSLDQGHSTPGVLRPLEDIGFLPMIVGGNNADHIDLGWGRVRYIAFDSLVVEVPRFFSLSIFPYLDSLSTALNTGSVVDERGDNYAEADSVRIGSVMRAELTGTDMGD